MTREDYKVLATVMGEAFNTASERGGEGAYQLVYDAVYTPLVIALRADNKNFDQCRFSYACAVATGKAAGLV